LRKEELVGSRRARIVCTAGARPNFMKIAPILEQIRRRPRLEPILVHTGQHYDSAMSAAFFRDLAIPEPDVHLGVGAESPTRQVARILERLEPELQRLRPDCVVVVGDVNSTLACALTAAKSWFPVAHVEAGLRSGDRTMPEELNRLLTDACSDLLFTTSRDANENLRREGVPEGRIHFVGNVMIDTLLRFEERSRSSPVLEAIGVDPRGYALVTLHRPSNVDRIDDLKKVTAILEQLARRLPVVFPIHPRTRARMQEEGILERLSAAQSLHLREPEGYIDFLRLLSAAKIVLTDSGGVQEETTVLGVPCLTLRPNTERPVTITEGTNRLIGSEPEVVIREVDDLLSGRTQLPRRIPELWDGGAAARIVAVLEEVYAS
jgi:UDP-N-acetylglucosamine 2-epimerase (non-hydrolysing)